jgi:hypothetical protein
MGDKREMKNHLSEEDKKGMSSLKLSRRKFLKLTAMVGLSVGGVGIHKGSHSAPAVKSGRFKQWKRKMDSNLLPELYCPVWNCCKGGQWECRSNQRKSILTHF